MAKFDRSAMRERLKARMHGSQKSKDDGAVTFSTYYELPANVSEWKPTGDKKGKEHFFDIVPFQVGDKYPLTRDPDTDRAVRLEKGDWTYLLDVWVHRGVGPDNETVVCPRKSYGEPCPICEHAQELLADEDDKEERKKIFGDKMPKRRVMYNVLVYDNADEEEKGVQVFEVAHWFMEKELQEAATLPRGGGQIFYADPVDGKMIYFKIVKRGENKIEFTGHKFMDRDYEITDDIIEQAHCLDSFLKVYSYDELYSKYWGDSGGHAPAVDDTEDDVPMGTVPDDKCPYGGVFGKEYNEYQECDKCDLADECMAQSEQAGGDEEPPWNGGEADKQVDDAEVSQVPTRRRRLVRNNRK